MRRAGAACHFMRSAWMPCISVENKMREEGSNGLPGSPFEWVMKTNILIYKGSSALHGDTAAGEEIQVAKCNHSSSDRWMRFFFWWWQIIWKMCDPLSYLYKHIAWDEGKEEAEVPSSPSSDALRLNEGYLTLQQVVIVDGTNERRRSLCYFIPPERGIMRPELLIYSTSV